MDALISNAFDQHEARNHDGFMKAMESILGEERLGEALFTIMFEHDITDYMDILVLLSGRNWTSQDAMYYQSCTIKDLIDYKPEKYEGIDTILGLGVHATKDQLRQELQKLHFKAPTGKTSWPRFQEKYFSEVSLYDIIVALVKQVDRESPKALFYKLQEVIGIKKT